MNDKIPYINKADAVAFYYIYLLAFNDGFDLRTFSEETKRMKELYNYAKRRIQYFDDHKIQWCIEKYQYKNKTLKELNDEFKERDFWKNYQVSMNIVCCNSCHSGSSSTPFEDIEEQRIKYGEYICKRCEENSLIAGQTQDLKDSLKRKLMLAKNGLYYDEGG